MDSQPSAKLVSPLHRRPRRSLALAVVAGLGFALVPSIWAPAAWASASRVGAAINQPADGETAARGRAQSLVGTAAQPTIEETLDVSVITFEVFVTDRSGEAVRGLGADDFTVTSGKKKIKPAFFQEVRRDAAPYEPGSLIVVLDQRHLRASNRERILFDLGPSVRRLMDQARMRTMVITYDGALRVVQELTHDPNAIGAALAALATQPATDPALESLHRGTRLSIERALAQSRGSFHDQVALQAQFEALIAEFRSYSKTVHQDVEETLVALRSVVWSLAQVPGRKAILYLSDGLAMRPLDSLLDTLQTMMRGVNRGGELVTARGGGGQAGESQDGIGSGMFSRDGTLLFGRLQQAVEPFNSTRSLPDLIAEANSYRVSFYPIKAPPGDVMSAEASGKGMAGLELSDLRQSLNRLAEGTGGRAHTAETEIESFVAGLKADFVHYYSIGITPDSGKPADPYAELQIKTKRRGWKARSRDGYLVKSANERLEEATLGSLAVGADHNIHLLEVKAVPSGQSSADGLADVTIEVEMPILLLGLTQAADGTRRAVARLSAVVLTSNSQILATAQSDVPLVVPSSEVKIAKSSYFKTEIGLRLPPGTHRLGISLWDQIRQLGSFVHRELIVGPTQEVAWSEPPGSDEPSSAVIALGQSVAP